MKREFIGLVMMMGLAPLAVFSAESSDTGNMNPYSSRGAQPAVSNDLVTPNTGPMAMDEVSTVPVPVEGAANNSATVDLVGNVPNSPALDYLQATDFQAHAFAKVHHVNMMEIEMGKMAMKKGQTKKVRDYGERLMRDHQMSDRKLMAFAESKNIPIDRAGAITEEDAAKERAASDKLNAAMAEDFDRLFLQQMAEGHAKTVNELSSAIVQMPNGAPRRFLTKIRPIIGQHEKLANILLQKAAG